MHVPISHQNWDVQVQEAQSLLPAAIRMEERPPTATVAPGTCPCLTTLAQTKKPHSIDKYHRIMYHNYKLTHSCEK